ncbi:OmpA family protein [Variovorax sp. J22R133]|uniref:OmpA family protein n=1 Tax=Variovorax brevis TaxID=3053503 RepID=UPI002577D287|nr:OmpA family protein [Variovorax sp. J22R133]MDM0110792.1 OmpA family protein [Variovorax sp. J22R133]
MRAFRFTPYPMCLAVSLMAGCSAPSPGTPAATSATPAASAASAAPARVASASSSPADLPMQCAAPSQELEAPEATSFEESIARAGARLLDQARRCVGDESRTLVVDPLIDANTGAQTASTVKMGGQLESIVKTRHANWRVQPLTRQALNDKPLLLIGTLTPVNVKRSIDTVPDAFRVWLTVIDLRTGRVVAKQLDRSTVGTVNPEPLKFYSDSPTWHKDKTVSGYINSCQVNTRIGDPADPEYLARLPAAAVVNEAIIAYSGGQVPAANQLYKEAAKLAEPGDLRVLNGLYLTNWQLGKRDEARETFGKLVASGLESERLPMKFLFRPGTTSFETIGDLDKQYDIWVTTLAQELGKAKACVRIVGHTSRTGSARANERLSRQRAEAMESMLERDNRALGTRLTAAGVGSREALVGLGTDDLRDALDRRVEFRVVGCV